MSCQKLVQSTYLISKFSSRLEPQMRRLLAGISQQIPHTSSSFLHLTRRLQVPGVSEPFSVNSLRSPSIRRISMFSSCNNNKKSAPNSEPHINDAKARPAEQGLRLDDEVQHDHTMDPDTEIEKQLRAELSKAVSESAVLLAKSREFEDKYKRALAETENVRARLTKQISDGKLFAIQGFCKDLSEIADILRMAIDSVPEDQVTDDNKHLKQLYEGLKMTDARMFQVFARHGLTQINPIDTKFNPNEHEAVVQQEVVGKESGTVIFVSKVGYKLNDRVIRPAVVGVAK